MALTINTNTAANAASVNLQSSNDLLQKSLNRLSSGYKIASPADDAGGLAVSMKLTAAIRRTEALNVNIANAVSFLQTQDGAMSTGNRILQRVAELKMLFEDVTKGAQDKTNYNAEFDQLKAQLSSLNKESFNGVALFGVGTRDVVTSEDGTQKLTLTLQNLSIVFGQVTSATGLSALEITQINNSIQSLATARALNGAESSRLNFACELLTINRQNLEAANSRIIDTDVAFESTNFARYNILVQSGTAMLAQANVTPQIALKLLG
ncbi:MAG: flagellin [Verrucomicrobia bacterium 21-51-4]|nr:MAG: flagellin [Verrucomicrobia bacterium 21-51-4]HQU09073.1 flagellin [Opitutales bacterium]